MEPPCPAADGDYSLGGMYPLIRSWLYFLSSYTLVDPTSLPILPPPYPPSLAHSPTRNNILSSLQDNQIPAPQSVRSYLQVSEKADPTAAAGAVGAAKSKVPLNW